jgi:hypothetical protein
MGEQQFTANPYHQSALLGIKAVNQTTKKNKK